MLPSPTTVPPATWILSFFNVSIGEGSELKSESTCSAVNAILGLFSAGTAENVGISTESVPAKAESAPSIVSVASTMPSSSMSSPKNGATSATSNSKLSVLFQETGVSPWLNSPVTVKFELPNFSWSLSNLLPLAKI